MIIENEKRFLRFLKKVPHLLLFSFVGLLFVSTSYSADDDEQAVPLYLDSNGDICKRCDASYSPNVYYSMLEDNFNLPSNQKHSRNEIIKYIEEMVKKELADIAIFVGQRNEDKSEGSGDIDLHIENKIEGFKVLASVLRIHYGGWAEEIVSDLLSSENEICAFDEAGNICDSVKYGYGDEECSKCQKLSFYQVLDLMKNSKKAFQLKSSLSTPSKIAEKFVGKAACKEGEGAKGQLAEADKLQIFCGILNSKRIIDSFTAHKSLAYVGFEDNSYSCKKVGLFFKKNAKTHKIEPDSDKSFLVYPDGTRQDLEDDQVKQIIKKIYQVREF